MRRLEGHLCVIVVNFHRVFRESGFLLRWYCAFMTVILLMESTIILLLSLCLYVIEGSVTEVIMEVAVVRYSDNVHFKRYVQKIIEKQSIFRRSSLLPDLRSHNTKHRTDRGRLHLLRLF